MRFQTTTKLPAILSITMWLHMPSLYAIARRITPWDPNKPITSSNNRWSIWIYRTFLINANTCRFTIVCRTLRLRRYSSETWAKSLIPTCRIQVSRELPRYVNRLRSHRDCCDEEENFKDTLLFVGHFQQYRTEKKKYGETERASRRTFRDGRSGW